MLSFCGSFSKIIMKTDCYFHNFRKSIEMEEITVTSKKYPIESQLFSNDFILCGIHRHVKACTGSQLGMERINVSY